MQSSPGRIRYTALPSRRDATLLDEDDLVAALRAGDEQAFATLVGRHTPGLLRLARGHVRDAGAAEEVVQETWLALLRGLDGFEQRSSLQTWLYRVALNRARTRGVRDARTDGARPAVDPDRFRPAGRPGVARATGPTRRAPGSATRRCRCSPRRCSPSCGRAIEDLPPRQREVVVLRDVEGLSTEEVAEVLGLTRGQRPRAAAPRPLRRPPTAGGVPVMTMDEDLACRELVELVTEHLEGALDPHARPAAARAPRGLRGLHRPRRAGAGGGGADGCAAAGGRPAGLTARLVQEQRARTPR